MSSESSQELLARAKAPIEQHLALYLESGGREGHVRDFTWVGGPGLLPTLLLKTIGRRSGQPRFAPLIYGLWGGEWVVVGSKGGAPQHPAWFLNLQPGQEVAFQVATEAFHASWRLAEGAEREAIWRYMARLYPPYDDYQASTGREIPIVLLRPIGQAPVFKAAAASG
jgi:deazaflavin-dependent oxidoreductase (nitroreductase family)